MARRRRPSGRRVVLVVQNMSVPRDRRVWREARALRDSGFCVTVLCPDTGEERGRVVLEGIEVHRFHLPPTGTGQLGFLVETAISMTAVAVLLARIALRERIDVVQVCNPPETYFPLGWALRRGGSAFVFDHHDPTPELYDSRFSRPRPWLRRALLFLERRTFAAADHVVTTNESLRAIALRRGGCSPRDVTVVRNGPEASLMRRREPVTDLRRGRAHLAVYVGALAPNDGVESLVRAVAHYVEVLGRTDCTVAVIGAGESSMSLAALVEELGMQSYIDMPGWLDDQELFAYLSTADVGICPEPATEVNLRSSMIKTTEYMAFELPVLATDLRETRASAGDAARYVRPDDPSDLATGLAELLDDPELRRRLGRAGRARVDGGLSWEAQSRRYVDVFEDLTVSKVPA